MTTPQDKSQQGPYMAYRSAVDPNCWLVRLGTIGPVYEYPTPIQAGDACDALNAAYAAGQAARWIPVSEDEALAIAHEWGAELAHVKEFMLWAAEQINKHRSGPVVTHINIDPDASDETKMAIGDIVRAAYTYKPPPTNP